MTMLLVLFALHKPATMPRGKQYSDAEKLLIARAYAWATNDEIKGAEQKVASYIVIVLDV